MFHDCRLRAANKTNAGVKKSRPRDRGGRGMPIPDSKAELQANIDVCQISTSFICANTFCLGEYFILLIFFLWMKRLLKTLIFTCIHLSKITLEMSPILFSSLTNDPITNLHVV